MANARGMSEILYRDETWPIHKNSEARMLYYAIVFFIVAIIAAILGFGGIAAGAAGIAKILFVVFLILAILTFLRRA